MIQTTKPILMAVSLLALTACGDRNAFESWNQPAGAFLDRGTFGAAALNNEQYHTGERSYAVDLNQRFSREVQSTVTFATDSAVLDPDARAVLNVQASWIRQFPEVRFKVYGHTDLVGSVAYNKRLGKRRANAVVSYLESQGISRGRLEALVSFGETRPLIFTENEERQNRRTVTEVAGLMQGHKAGLNGKYAELILREYVESATEITTSEGGLAAIEGAGG